MPTIMRLSGRRCHGESRREWSPAVVGSEDGRVKCVILDDYQGTATTYADWGSLPLDVETVREHLDEDGTAAVLAGAEVVVLMRERTPLTRSLLDRLPALRLVVTTGMRNASIDVVACAERGIPVCGTGSSKTSTAELTWALVLGLLRRVVPEARGLAAGGWQTTVGSDLAGRTLGLLGLGAIGSRVARVGAALDMDVVAWSPHLTEERAYDGGARLVGRDELFGGADVLSLHLVLAPGTRGLVGERELGLMRPSSYLVNTSRAGLVDTGALLRVLDDGRLAGAALDVFDTEPLPAGHPLRDHPRVLATPHLGYVTEANYRRFFGAAVEDVAAWLAGSPVRLLG
jgi:phosphoglycerate dehydrogenase-like enzyme